MKNCIRIYILFVILYGAPKAFENSYLKRKRYADHWKDNETYLMPVAKISRNENYDFSSRSVASPQMHQNSSVNQKYRLVPIKQNFQFQLYTLNNFSASQDNSLESSFTRDYLYEERKKIKNEIKKNNNHKEFDENIFNFKLKSKENNKKSTKLFDLHNKNCTNSLSIDEIEVAYILSHMG